MNQPVSTNPAEQSPETLESLWSYCTAEKRLVPQPALWSDLYSKLRHTRQKPSGGWEPPLPMILAAWHHAMPIEKQLCLKEHLEWAPQQGQLDEIRAFLRSLSEQDVDDPLGEMYGSYLTRETLPPDPEKIKSRWI